MSLAVAIKGPEGIVLAADSRVTLQVTTPDGQLLPIFYDNATKVLAFSKHPFVGAVTYGAAVLGGRTPHSLMPEFEVELGDDRRGVEEIASLLSTFFLERWKATMPKHYKGPPMTFVVAGFDERQAYGEVRLFEIPNAPRPVLRTGVDGFGMTWGGQLDIVSRIVHGFDPSFADLLARTSKNPKETVEQWLQSVRNELELSVPYEFLPLQDCINLAAAMVRTTMVFQDTAVRLRGVGGPIDIAVITRVEGLQFVQRKALVGEMGYSGTGGVNRERQPDVHSQRAERPVRRAARRGAGAGRQR